MAEHDDGRVSFVIDVTEPSSRPHLQVEDILYGGGITLEDGVLGLAVLVLHCVGADTELRTEKADSRSHRLYVRQLLNSFCVLKGQLFARPRLLTGAAKSERFNMKSENNV